MAVTLLPPRPPSALVAGGVVLGAWVAVDVLADFQVSGLFCLAALVVAVSASPRQTLMISVAAVTAAVASGLWNDNLGSAAWLVRLAGCVIGCASAIVAAQLMEHHRQVLQHTSSLAQGLLDALAVELTGARTVKEVASGFVGRAAARLGASSGMVFVLDADQMMRSIVWMGRGGPEADRYTEFPVDADLPGAIAAREGTPRHYRNRAAIEAQFPQLRGYYRDDRSLHVLPLTRGDRTVGLLALTFPVGVIVTAEEGLLVAFSGALAAALTRAQELEAADAAAQRTQLLAEASLSLFRTHDVDGTLAEACRLLVPRLADWCVIHQLKDGQLVTAALRHRDPQVTAWAQSMRDVFPADMDAATGAPAVIRTGRSELYPYIPRELLDAAATSDEHAEVLHRLGMVSAVIAPMPGHDGVIGAISLAHAESGRRFTSEDVRFLEDLARRIGLAMDTATTLSEQRDRLTDVTAIAEAAQLAILAPVPARVGSLRLSARYVSAAEEAQIGGDLYEVVPVEDRVRLLVGDVRGKGLPAVRTATVVLGEFRAAATQEPALPALAKRLDQQLRPWLDSEEDFVTACLIDIGPDGFFEAVSCGHPPPFHISGDGWQPIALDPAPPLGLGVEPTPGRGRLHRRDRLLLHTDGLLEARTAVGHFFDPDTLQVLAAHEPFEQVLDGMLQQLRANTSQRLQDDLALLLVGYDPSDAAPPGPALGRGLSTDG
ncbi:SpoIIE family protein phosphatase [Terrabacter sp. BE26]|uniref:SpoIIE family protein phosphatase n=1 Tax=Terrabacter sp. BE26 TaxID=2898152 RepID=UPI0035BE7CED